MASLRPHLLVTATILGRLPLNDISGFGEVFVPGLTFYGPEVVKSKGYGMQAILHFSLRFAKPLCIPIV
jgi:hypothetical protein